MTAYRYVRTGRLPARREGVQWMVDPEDLAKMRPPSGRRGGTAPSVGRASEARRLEWRRGRSRAWAMSKRRWHQASRRPTSTSIFSCPPSRSVGEGWAAGELTVADEHRATAIVLRLVGRLGPRFARRGRKRGTVVVGAPAGEHMHSRRRSSRICYEGSGSKCSTWEPTLRRRRSRRPRRRPTAWSRPRSRSRLPLRRGRPRCREGDSPGRPGCADPGRRGGCPHRAQSPPGCGRGRVSMVGARWWRSSESHVRAIVPDRDVVASSAIVCAMRRKMSV